MPFRPATLADLDALVPLMQAFYAEDRHPWKEDAARETLGALLRDSGYGRAFLIEEDGRLVGYLVVCFGFSLEFHGRDAFLDELYVVPAQRGRGLGTQALRVAEDCCREAGARALHLEVGHTNDSARRLYHSWGFAERPFALMSKPLR
ncbi:MAG TPA: GNAT family N-acetyltransferase [Vicinamibacteria bacterium]